MKLDEKQCPCQGRLFFFPSYFHKIGFDILAPVERKGRTVTNPIPMEVIPKGESSTFSLFYLADPNTPEQEAAKDLSFCLEVIETMLQETGFSAKKNTGYGQAELLNGKCLVNERSWQTEEISPVSQWNVPTQFRIFFQTAGNSPHDCLMKDRQKAREEYCKTKRDKYLKDKLKPKELKQLKIEQEKIKRAKAEGFNEEDQQQLFNQDMRKCDEWWEAEKKNYPSPQPRRISKLPFNKITDLLGKIRKFWGNES